MDQELHGADKFLLTTHENADGDTLGSLLGDARRMTQFGKDALMYLSPDEYPLPHEYHDMENHNIVGAPPADMDERMADTLDYGDIDRMPVDFLQREDIHILDIDRRHDDSASARRISSTACVLHRRDRLATRQGARRRADEGDRTRPLRRTVADTGRFIYGNSTAEAHRWPPS